MNQKKDIGAGLVQNQSVNFGSETLKNVHHCVCVWDTVMSHLTAFVISGNN